MRPKHAEKAEARQLRSEHGTPMKQIASRLGVSVGSVHLWTSDIEVTPEQRARNLREAKKVRAAVWSGINRRRRLAYQREGRARALEGDSFHEAGCMLYWAEGSKEPNSITFANSDVHMLRFFRNFLTTCLGVHPGKMTIRLNVYTTNGLSIKEIEQYWLNALDLPATALRVHSIDSQPTSSSGQKKNRLPYGVCTLRVYSTRLVQHIFGAIQEYAGFDEPRWLKTRPSNRRAGSPSLSPRP